MSNQEPDSPQSANAGSFFQGDERLETFPLIGRLIRKGNRTALAVSDADRVRQALKAGNGDLAKQYLSIIRANSEAMVVIYSEFILSFAPVLNEQTPPIDYKAAVLRAYELLKKSIELHPEFEGEPAEAVLRIFHPNRIRPETVGEFRGALLAGEKVAPMELLESTVGTFDSIMNAVGRGAYSEAISEFARYFTKMRTIHDILVDFDSLLIASINELHGQQIAERVLYKAFTTCTFYEGLWRAVAAMSHEETAAFLADHLRGHFSGKDAEGATEVVDEGDRYRLIFAPCGSGGSMRQRAARGLPNAAKPLAEATALTWFKRDEVPGYCSHCAVNELESMRRLGYPVFVTEFDRDPSRPCGWTVFKDPNQIPEEYFTRLGFTKDASAFKPPGTRT